MFNFEEQFRKEGISEDTDVTKVLSLIFDTRLLYFLNKDCNTVFNISQWLVSKMWLVSLAIMKWSIAFQNFKLSVFSKCFALGG